MFAAVIALKAYSKELSRKLFYSVVCAGSVGPTPILLAMLMDIKGLISEKHTNLIESALIREYSNMPIVSCTACARVGKLSGGWVKGEGP